MQTWHRLEGREGTAGAVFVPREAHGSARFRAKRKAGSETLPCQVQ